LVVNYDLRPGNGLNGVGLFSREKTDLIRKKVKKKDKWGSIRCKQANDIGLQRRNQQMNQGRSTPGARTHGDLGQRNTVLQPLTGLEFSGLTGYVTFSKHKFKCVDRCIILYKILELSMHTRKASIAGHLSIENNIIHIFSFST